MEWMGGVARKLSKSKGELYGDPELLSSPCSLPTRPLFGMATGGLVFRDSDALGITVSGDEGGEVPWLQVYFMEEQDGCRTRLYSLPS